MTQLLAACALPAGLRLRNEIAADIEPLAEIFIETRAAEFAPSGWDRETVRAFLSEQFELQRAHYRKVYEGAEFLVIERDGAVIGRLYLYHAGRELRLMDIALAARERGQGIGSALLAGILDAARRLDCDVTLHVEPGNPARSLYLRHGFRLVEQRGVYDFLGWNRDAGAPSFAARA